MTTGAHDAGECRDECAAQGGAGEQLEHEIGYAERYEVRIEVRAGAKLVCDGDRAKQAKQAAAEESQCDDRGGHRETGGATSGAGPASSSSEKKRSRRVRIMGCVPSEARPGAW